MPESKTTKAGGRGNRAGAVTGRVITGDGDVKDVKLVPDKREKGSDAKQAAQKKIFEKAIADRISSNE